METKTTDQRRIWWIVAGAVVVAIAVGAFGAPLGTVLLVGVLLLCPLMMMGMHGGHESHAGHGTYQRQEQPPSSDAGEAEHGHGPSPGSPNRG